MTKTKLILFLLLFASVVCFTFMCIPPKFYTDGGSCMPGITVSVHLMFLIASVILACISLLITHVKTSPLLAMASSIFSFGLWGFWFGTISMNETLNVTVYLVPYFLISLALVVINIKAYKKQKLN